MVGTASTPTDVVASDATPEAPAPDAPTGRWWTDRQTWFGVGRELLIFVLFLGVAVGLRGSLLHVATQLNPDEAELIAQGRAAMRSPVPFTTWTTATTGPVWVLFLALVGAVGLPMTIAFAHLLAAVLLGVLGHLGFVLARRWLPAVMSAVITVFWWLPIVLTLTGSIDDFAPLATELLPCVLLLAAALFRPETLARRPVLFLAAGVVCGLSVGAKYQAAPVAVALLAVQLILGGTYRPRVLLRAAVTWGIGALLPFVVVGLSMVLSSDVSWTAVTQNLNFLGAYGGGTTLNQRLAIWSTMVTSTHVVILVLVLCWLGTRSRERVQLCRIILALSGFVAVYIGGTASGHYMFFVYTALVLAIGLPLKPDARLVPHVRHELVASGVVAAVLVAAWFVSFGTSVGTADLTGPGALSVALSKDSVVREPAMAEACPAGSRVLVWGWAGELYVHYDWDNAIPFMNITQVTASPKNYEPGYDMVRKAVDDPATDCVVDAVGSPFFSLGADQSLTTVYPQVSGLLDAEYRKAEGVFPCEICDVYVRR